MDGSCHDSPIRSGFGGILRNNAGFFLYAFSGFISGSDDIILTELSSIYHGLIIAKILGFCGVGLLLRFSCFQSHERPPREISCLCCSCTRHKRATSSK